MISPASWLHAVDNPEFLHPEILRSVDVALQIELHLVIALELPGISAIVTVAVELLAIGPSHQHPLEVTGVIHDHDGLRRAGPEADVANRAGHGGRGLIEKLPDEAAILVKHLEAVVLAVA